IIRATITRLCNARAHPRACVHMPLPRLAGTIAELMKRICAIEVLSRRRKLEPLLVEGDVLHWIVLLVQGPKFQIGRRCAGCNESVTEFHAVRLLRSFQTPPNWRANSALSIFSFPRIFLGCIREQVPISFGLFAGSLSE